MDISGIISFYFYILFYRLSVTSFTFKNYCKKIADTKLVIKGMKFFMHKHINKYIVFGIIFTVISGTLLHFVYEWLGKNPIVGLFSPVNESVWEHLKLLYYPMTIWVFGGYFKYGRKNRNFFFSALAGLISGLVSIPLIFYFYTAITGQNYLAADIITFIIGTGLSYLIMGYFLKNYNMRILSVKAGIMLWELFFLFFAIFTAFPPNLPIFK